MMKTLLLYFKPIFAVWLAVGPLLNPIGYNPQPTAGCLLCLKTDNAPLFAAPAAQPDAYTAGENTQLVVDASSGVLSNDSDEDLDVLSAVLETDVSHGVLHLASDGSFTYDPETDFTGSDTFTYFAFDGAENSAETTVTITVNATPSAAADTYTVLENVTFNQSAPGVLFNDTDPESDPLTATLVDDVTQGSLTFNEDGSFSYTPPANTHGSATFTYTATDGYSTSDSALVTLNINGAPDTTADSYETDEDLALTVSAPGVLSNDTDPESETLTAVLNQNVQHGTLNLSSNGSFTYTPTDGYNGSDQFSYYANDGHQNSPSTTVTITINAANDAPVAVDDSYSTPEDTTLTVLVANSILKNDSDPDGDTLTAVKASDPAHGTLTLNANGSFTYIPNANYHGSDSFTYKANDGALESNTATVTITITPVNDTPVAVDDSYSTPEDTTLTVLIANSILKNDSDPDGDTLTAVKASDPAHGTLTLNANGSFTYIPNANYHGSDFFTYKANDGALESNTATVTITITPVNDTPVAVDDSYSTPEDTTLTVLVANSILKNDSDPDGDTLTAVKASDPAHGTLTLNANGSFTYDPDDNYHGSDFFTYKANDGALDSNTATVTITITPVNDTPVAVNDTYTTAEDTLLSVAAPGVLSNDSDVDGDSLTAILVTDAAHGTLTLNANGSFTYDPDDNYHGSDFFTYKANDGALESNTTTVTITITDTNDTPVAVDDSYTTAEDTTLTVLVANSILKNDSDPDGDELSTILVTDAAHGTLTLNANGSFTYIPNANYHGSDFFTYKANDGALDSAAATVTITITPVNDTPVAVNDAFTTAEDTLLSVAAPGVLSNDSDADGDSLTAILVTDVSHGTLTLNANGSFTYDPDDNYHGSDSFTYKANDGALESNTATVTITITDTNDPPVAVDDSYSTPEDTTLTVLVANSILKNDSDPDGDELSAILVTDAAHGTLTLNANGSFTYDPDDNYHGSDFFTYKANDGALESNTATVTITITPVNDTPVAVNDTYSTAEDTLLSVAAPGVLSNDSDVDGDSLTAVLVTDVSHGTLTLNANGSFTYDPDDNYHGSDSFTYKANDGALESNTATVTITVTAVNDPPVAVNDTYTTAEDTLLSVAAPGVLSNDSDADGDSLTAILVTDAAHGTLTLNANGSFTYDPDDNYHGSDFFTYKANDGALESNTATVTITITDTNDAPVAVDDSYTTAEDTTLTVLVANSILKNDSDPDGDELSAILVTDAAHGTLTLNANGSFTYVPNTNYTGSDSFTYKANDGALESNTATVTITITPVNDTPVAVNDTYSTAEDTLLSVAAPGVLSNDSDVDGDSLTAVLVTDVSHGTLTLNANGSFTYDPDDNYHGSDSFTYKANDGALESNTATVTITITPVNDTPVAVNDTYTTAEDTLLSVAAPGVLSNDTDVDGDSLTAILVTDAAHGTLTLNANGSFTYVPDDNYHGSDSFTYKANDGTADSAAATVTITITPVNDPPVAVNDAFTTAEDTLLSVAAPGVLSNDSDADGDSLTAILVTDVSHGTLTLNANGSFTYVPNTNYTGSDSFTYKANDGALESNTATVTITITPVNDTPVAVNDTYSTAEDTLLSVAAPGVLSNDSDADGDSLTAVLVTDVSHGTLTLNANGSFTYDPDDNYHGSDSFTYKANDGTADSAAATVTITITPVNDPPVAVNDAFTTAEDTLLSVAAPGVLSNDSDVDGDSLTAILVTDAAHGTLTLNANGSFTYVPNANYHGSDSFTYKANDGALDSAAATVTITVTAVNDPPVAVDDSYTTAEDSALIVTAPGVLQNDSDIDLDPLTVILDTTTAHGTLVLNTDGSFIYMPASDYNGTDTFTYHVNDGVANSAPATVTITITPVNDAPKAYNEAFTTLEDTLLEVSAPGILTNDTDVDGDTLTAVLVTTTANGTLTLNPNGSFTYQPTLNFAGTDSFTYTVSDGTASSNTATATITIIPVNDAPVGVADSHTLLEDNTLTVAAPGVLQNDTDIEGDALTAVLNQTVNHGTLTLNANGSFTYTPNANYNGSDSFSYRAYDGNLYSAITTVSLTITAVNDAPVASADTYVASLGSVLTVDAPGVLDNDTDIENDNLTARLLTPPAKGELVFHSDGSFVYTTDPNSFTPATFTYEAYDGDLASASATVTIQIISGAVIGVNWTNPTTNSQVYIAEDEFIQVEVEITNCTSGCSARFFRWDREVGSFVDILIDDTAPYQATIHSKNISPGWNEFDVVAFDGEGHASQRRHIWIWRDYWNYMPMPMQ